MSDDGNGSTSTATNKVDRAIETYDLDGLGGELERLWLGEGVEQHSTRDLADLFNRRILASAIEESDVFTLSGDIERAYENLTGDDAGDRAHVRSRLEQNGVDVDGLLSDFVSHQTIYRYLTDLRGVERPEKTDEERIEAATDTIQRMRGRTTAVTEQTIESLRTNGNVSVGEFDVLNDLQVLCRDCGRSYDVVAFLERGECDCAD